jgi:hypothetical protein
MRDFGTALIAESEIPVIIGVTSIYWANNMAKGVKIISTKHTRENETGMAVRAARIVVFFVPEDRRRNLFQHANYL